MGISPVLFWWKQENSDGKIEFIFSATVGVTFEFSFYSFAITWP